MEKKNSIKKKNFTNSSNIFMPEIISIIQKDFKIGFKMKN